MSEELLITTFCIIDDFCSSFETAWNHKLVQHTKNQGIKKPSRRPKLSLSELMTIVIGFHRSGYRTFKHHYTNYAMQFWHKFFPHLVSYARIVRLIQRIIFPMFCFLNSVLGVCTGISFVDSTLLIVCHIKREKSHKVFKAAAKKGKVSTGWFFGMKLHLIINEFGEIISFMLTAGNASDLSALTHLVQNCFGQLFGDKGYISQSTFEKLFSQGIQLITKVRKNMKNKLLPLIDKLLLKKRGLIESVNDRLKNGCQIEHHRHRSPLNFVVNLLSGLSAYQLQEKKPSIYVSKKEQFILQAA